MGKGQSHEHLPLIISKIESVEALVNFDAILEESDGIMVARGDLAVEIPMETLANVQKEIVARCNRAGKTLIYLFNYLLFHSFWSIYWLDWQASLLLSLLKCWRQCRRILAPLELSAQMLPMLSLTVLTASCSPEVRNFLSDNSSCCLIGWFIYLLESAKGRYPVETISIMNRIVQQSELAQAGQYRY